jgi:hypothetical protein
VRIEVHHRHAAVAVLPGDPRDVGERDRVVTAEDHGDGAARCDRRHRLRERRQGPLDVAGRHLDVAGVQDAQVAQPVDPQGEVRARPVVRQVVRRPDGLRSEAGPGAVRGAAVEGRADDHDVGTGP